MGRVSPVDGPEGRRRRRAREVEAGRPIDQGSRADGGIAVVEGHRARGRRQPRAAAHHGRELHPCAAGCRHLQCRRRRRRSDRQAAGLRGRRMQRVARILGPDAARAHRQVVQGQEGLAVDDRGRAQQRGAAVELHLARGRRQARRLAGRQPRRQGDVLPIGGPVAGREAQPDAGGRAVDELGAHGRDGRRPDRVARVGRPDGVGAHRQLIGHEGGLAIDHRRAADDGVAAEKGHHAPGVGAGDAGRQRHGRAQRHRPAQRTERHAADGGRVGQQFDIRPAAQLAHVDRVGQLRDAQDARGAVVGGAGDVAQRIDLPGQAVGAVVEAPDLLVLVRARRAQGLHTGGGVGRAPRGGGLPCLVHQHGGVDARGVGHGLAQQAVGVVDVLGHRPGGVDVGHLAPGFVVQHPAARAGRVLRHQQAPFAVVGIGGGAQHADAHAGLGDADQPPGVVVGRQGAQAVGQRDGGAPVGIVVVGEGDVLGGAVQRGAAGRDHAAQAVVDVAGHPGGVVGLDLLQQQALLVVDVLCGGRTGGHALAIGAGLGIGGRAAQRAPAVVAVVGALAAGEVLPLAPSHQLRLGGHSLRAQRACVIRRRGVADGAGALAPAVVQILGDVALGADDETQPVVVALGIDVAGGLGQAGRGVEGAAVHDGGVGIEGVGQQLVGRAVGARTRVAGRVDLLEQVAVRVVLEADLAAFSVRHADDVALGVVQVAHLAQPGRVGRRHALAHLGQLSLGVVQVDAGRAQGVGDGSRASDIVVGEGGDRAQRIGDGLDLVAAAHLLVGEAQRRAVGLGDAGHALAGAVVGVGGDVGAAVGDAAVRGTEVDGDADEAVARIVGVANARGGDVVRGDGADLGEVVAGVVVPGDFAVGIRQRFDVAGGVVAQGDDVAVGVGGRDETPLAAGLVALGHAAVAVRPHQLRGTRVMGDGVEGARPGGAQVQAAGGIPGVGGLRAVAIDPGDGAAGLAQGARNADALAEGTNGPVVLVVVGEQPLAVVGAHADHVQAAAEQKFVPVLQHQVAGGHVHVGLLAAAALPQRTQRSALPQGGH